MFPYYAFLVLARTKQLAEGSDVLDEILLPPHVGHANSLGHQRIDDIGVSTSCYIVRVDRGIGGGLCLVFVSDYHIHVLVCRNGPTDNKAA